VTEHNRHDRATPELLEQAALYVLGMMAGEEGRLFELHLLDCSVCSREVADTREALAGLALEADAFEPAARLRERLLESIQSAGDAPGGGNQTQVWKNWAPPKAGGIHVVRGGESGWKTILDGVEVKQLFADPAAANVTMLVRMAPGSEYPAHRHGGHEQCFVIEGDVQVGGIDLSAGDYQCATAASVHEVTRTRGGCVLMIVSSTRDELLP
jgi:anti-sigma factor ChrR (cupin superfamily)